MTFTLHHRAIKTRKAQNQQKNKEADDCGITDQKHPTPTNARNYLNVSLFFLLI